LAFDLLDLGAPRAEGREPAEGEGEVVVRLLVREEPGRGQVSVGGFGLFSCLFPGAGLVHPEQGLTRLEVGGGLVIPRRPCEVAEIEAGMAREAQEARVVGPGREEQAEGVAQLEVASAQVEEVGLFLRGIVSARLEGEAGVQGGVGLVLEPEAQRGFRLEEELVGVQRPLPLDLAQLHRGGQALAHGEESLGEVAPGARIGDDVVVPAVVPGLELDGPRFEHHRAELEARGTALSVILRGEGRIAVVEAVVDRLGGPFVVDRDREMVASGDDSEREVVFGGRRAAGDFRPGDKGSGLAAQDQVESEEAPVRDEEGVEVAIVLIAEKEAAGGAGRARHRELAFEDEVRMPVEGGLGPGEEIGALERQLEGRGRTPAVSGGIAFPLDLEEASRLLARHGAEPELLDEGPRFGRVGKPAEQPLYAFEHATGL
jgi:hypothetical protein